jgi:hypothetical protein
VTRFDASVGRHVAPTLATLVILVSCSTASGPSTGSSNVPNPSASASPSTVPSAATATDAGSTGPTPRAAVLAWSRLDASGPAAREDHTLTLDADGTRAYLFGGRDGETVYADLWAYDLEQDAWAEATPPSAPPARFGHEAAWIDGIGLVIFAGQAGTTFFNDLWAYDPAANSWTELPAGGSVPVARYGTCSAVGPDGRLWISHGFTSDGVRFSDTRAYDFTRGTWSDLTPSGERPVERCLHTCWLTDAGELALYAGQTTGVPALGDRWVLRDDGWKRVDGSLPPERNLPAHVRLDGATLIFGGTALDLALQDDLWVLRDDVPDASRLTPAGPGPSGRAGASLLLDAARARVLLFGGRTGAGASNETWSLSGLDPAP